MSLREFVRENFDRRMRDQNETADQAAAYLMDLGMGIDDVVREVRAEIAEEADRNRLLEFEGVVVDGTARDDHADQVSNSSWYAGPRPGDRHWPAHQAHLRETGREWLIRTVDDSSTRIVASLADPGVAGLRKKGLVLGHVQSGKTANYTAVIAKAADAGYRLVIVLAGMHNNLRKQTQERLADELFGDSWTVLTTEDQDFGRPTVATTQLTTPGVAVAAVVKKNPTRLRSLIAWLRTIVPNVRQRCPILILDDEADQATPNTAAGRDELSTINALMREVWSLVGRGTYLAYTATPFANVLMDPDDSEELFPSDFIIALDRPDTYYGAERVFRPGDAEDDGPDLVRTVPVDDAALLQPPARGEGGWTVPPDLVPSLREAVYYFVVSCAVRRARGHENKHMSMLVHTTHRTEPHREMARALQQFVARLLGEMAEQGDFMLRGVWEKERFRASSERPGKPEEWCDVAPRISEVLDVLRVVVDNSESDERLDYQTKDEDGQIVPQTVIVVGGGTLSRGLTLEGLAVSYFTRSSRSFDTLLQMGRWFGFRPGYEDLQRVWVTSEMCADFVFLSEVEQELREEIEVLSRHRVSPADAGVRVRTHPGRLEVTARNRMHHAMEVSVGLGGKRLQTYSLPAREPARLRANLEAMRRLVTAAGEWEEIQPQKWLAEQVPSQRILSFLGEYRYGPEMTTFEQGLPGDWIRRYMGDAAWNVAVIGNSRAPQGKQVQVDAVGSVGLITRAPFKERPEYIKALVNPQDIVVDLPAGVAEGQNVRNAEVWRGLRSRHAPGTGLLLLYVVDKDSKPTVMGDRVPMEAVEHLVGFGIVFPDLGFASSTGLLSVRPDWTPVEDLDEVVPDDTEGSFNGEGAA